MGITLFSPLVANHGLGVVVNFQTAFDHAARVCFLKSMSAIAGC